MPKRKAAKAKKSRPVKTKTMAVDSAALTVEPREQNTFPEESNAIPKAPASWLFALILLALIAAVALWQNKGLIVAAMVNGQPVWRWELESRMTDRFGKQTLEEIINEQLIVQAATKKGITVSEQERNARIAELEKKLEGKISLKDALAQQGLSMDEFKHQITLQIMVEKLTADKVAVSSKEVADYIDKNKATMVATDEAGLTAEAKSTLENQKRSQAINEIFSELKKNAKVNRYL